MTGITGVWNRYTADEQNETIPPRRILDAFCLVTNSLRASSNEQCLQKSINFSGWNITHNETHLFVPYCSNFDNMRTVMRDILP